MYFRAVRCWIYSLGILAVLILPAAAAPLISNGDFSVSDGGLGAQDWAGGVRNTGTGGNNGQPDVLLLENPCLDPDRT